MARHGSLMLPQGSRSILKACTWQRYRPEIYLWRIWCDHCYLSQAHHDFEKRTIALLDLDVPRDLRCYFGLTPKQASLFVWRLSIDLRGLHWLWLPTNHDPAGPHLGSTEQMVFLVLSKVIETSSCNFERLDIATPAAGNSLIHCIWKRCQLTTSDIPASKAF